MRGDFGGGVARLIDDCDTAAPRGVEVDAPRLIDILSTCDLTRFAMARLEADSLVASTQAARDWITRLFAAAKPSPASPPVTP